MNLRPSRLGLVIFASCALGSYLATYAWQTPPAREIPPAPAPLPHQVLGGWLHLMPNQIERLADVDPQYAGETARLEQTLAAEREVLAALFENPDATNDEIMRQVEVVIDAHNELERRVAAYLIAVRPHLTDEQRARLFQRCARGIRKAGGWQWRHGFGGGRGPGRGRGGPPDGRGPQHGRGPGRGNVRGEPTSRPSP